MNKRATISGVFLGFAALFMSAGNAMAAIQTDVKIGVTAEKPVISVQKSSDIDFIKVAQRQISASQAKSIAMSRVPGGQYIDLRKSGNTYIVRIRDRNGRVRDIRIDATTGRVK